MGFTFVGDIEKRPQYDSSKTGAVFVLCPHCQELMYTTWKGYPLFAQASTDVDDFIIPNESIENRIARIEDMQKLTRSNFYLYTPEYVRNDFECCINCGKELEYKFLGAKFETSGVLSSSTISTAELNRRYNSLVNRIEKEYKLILDREDIEYLNACEEKLHLADMPANNKIAQKTIDNPNLIAKYIELILATEIKIKCTLQYRQVLKLQKRKCSVEKASLLATQQASCKKELQILEKTYDETIIKIKESKANELADQLKAFNIPMPKKRACTVTQDILLPETLEPSDFIKKGAPNPPEKPIFQKPGLFNRKRVEEENKALTDSYKQRLTNYEQELELYNNAVKVYKEMLANQTAAIQRKKQELEEENKLIELEYEKALQDYSSQKERYEKLCIQNNATEIERKIKQAEEKYLAQKHMCLQKLKMYEQSLNNDESEDELLLSKEISASEQHIEMLIKGRNTLLAYNIVFPKYRAIPVLHTFMEYLTSGRCSTLAGRDGAYNVYEAEARADKMIAQLSQITDILNVINEKQTLLYDEMREIKKQTEMLNHSLTKAIEEMQTANTNLTGLRENVSALHATEQESLETLKETRSLTDDLVHETGNISRKMDKVVKNTAVTAHYSAVTAYYSKQTAEMTDALGFMLALK